MILDIDLLSIDHALEVDFGVSGSDIQPYEGDYEVEPDFTPTVLDTAGKYMTNNVTVNRIRVAETANEYGTTVYIGKAVING